MVTEVMNMVGTAGLMNLTTCCARPGEAWGRDLKERIKLPAF